MIFLLVGLLLGQTVNVVTYDAFMQLDRQGRIHTFNQITADNRAEVVRTHIQRWLEANRPRMNAEQIKLMEECIAFATPEAYSLPKSAETLARAKELEARTALLFTRDEMFQALTIQGDYIRPKE